MERNQRTRDRTVADPRDDWTTEELQELTVRDRKWLIVVGPLTSGAILSAVAWNTAERWRLLAWMIGLVVISALNYVIYSRPLLHSRVNANRVATWGIAGAVMIGLWLGSILWLDAAIRETSLIRVSVIGVLFAVSAGAVGGTASRGGVATHLLIPMWGLTSLGLVVVGDWPLGLGSAAFVILMISDLQETHDLVQEVLDLKSLSRAQAKTANHNSLHDSLTGLANRTGLQNEVSEMLADPTLSPDTPITTMFVDLDHFKLVNDRFGHAAGDQVLIEVADRLVHTVRPYDTVARLGGDEFFLILSGDYKSERLDHLCQSIIAATEKPFRIGTAEARISASIGYSVSTVGTFDLARAQNDTDHAMYLAKGSGRRRAVRFDEAVQSELEQRSRLESMLRGAVEDGEIKAWGQDVVDLQSGERIIVELLARWDSGDGEFHPPSEFIPIAEEIGLINDLGAHMLDQAGEFLSNLRLAAPNGVIPSVSVNISPRQLLDAGFVDLVTDTLKRWNIKPGELILELTEMIGHYAHDEVASQLDRLVAVGPKISLDDFGSGYSSFQHLLGLPIEYVKLDGALVDNLESDPRLSRLISSVRDIAVTLGRTVIVEGVETEGQVALLAELDLHLIQGYYLGAPRPLAEILADSPSPVKAKPA